ncbi:MAG: HIRAN domain-containing protein [Clostridiales bacterium]|nr:HIRAN domain-containing protein [Clostridiales bacterium]
MADKQTAEQAATIRSGYFDRDAFKEKKKSILVLKTGVAGLYFHVDTKTDEGKTFLASLTPGTELRLFRDTDNEHDRWAISVYTSDDRELGYITRFKNETIARLMDYGKVFHAYVDEPRERPKDETEERRTVAPTENFALPFSIYMDD